MSRAPWTFAGLDRQALVLIGMCSLPFFLDCLIPAMMGPLAAPISQSLSLSSPRPCSAKKSQAQVASSSMAMYASRAAQTSLKYLPPSFSKISFRRPDR